VGRGWALPSQVREVPEPEHGGSKMEYFSMSLNFPTLVCFKFTLRGMESVGPLRVVTKVTEFIREEEDE
jgi:hypothetical protein